MGGVEVPQVPRRGGGWHGEEYPPPVGGRVWEGTVLPPQKIFRIFLLKIPYFDAF